MKKIILGFFIVLFFLSVGLCQEKPKDSSASAPIVDKKFPNLDCEALYVDGTFGSYSVIGAKDKLLLDLNKLNEVKDALSLTPGNDRMGSPYIPLLGSLNIEKMNKGKDGELIQMKLISLYAPEKRELVFDILNLGSSSYRMLILDNVSGYTTSLASFKCKEVVQELAEGGTCTKKEDCAAINCSKYDTPIKSGHKSSCENGWCKCMCYGCE